MDAIDLIKGLPYAQWKKAVRYFRKAFPRDWPENRPTIVVNLTHEDFETRLYNDLWEQTPYSLQYKQEVINMRKPFGHDDGHEREIHTRSRDHDKGIEIECHEEYSRYTEKRKHLNEPVESLKPEEIYETLPIRESEIVE